MKSKAVSRSRRLTRVLAAAVCWLTWSGSLSLADAPANHMASLLRGKLVTFANGTLQNYDDSKLTKKKYFGLYYSASWCQPCRTFTPELVSFYKQMAAAHPEFEIVFVSSDETPGNMEQYMKLDAMPWAALRFERKEHEAELAHYYHGGLPDLVIVDGNGRVLSDSFLRGEYIGPYKPMVDLARLLTASRQ